MLELIQKKEIEGYTIDFSKSYDDNFRDLEYFIRQKRDKQLPLIIHILSAGEILNGLVLLALIIPTCAFIGLITGMHNDPPEGTILHIFQWGWGFIIFRLGILGFYTEYKINAGKELKLLHSFYQKNWLDINLSTLIQDIYPFIQSIKYLREKKDWTKWIYVTQTEDPFSKEKYIDTNFELKDVQNAHKKLVRICYQTLIQEIIRIKMIHHTRQIPLDWKPQGLDDPLKEAWEKTSKSIRNWIYEAESIKLPSDYHYFMNRIKFLELCEKRLFVAKNNTDLTDSIRTLMYINKELSGIQPYVM